MNNNKTIDNKKKAAILLKMMGGDKADLTGIVNSDTAGNLKSMTADLGDVPPETMKSVLSEFVEILFREKTKKHSEEGQPDIGDTLEDDSFIILDYLDNVNRNMLFEAIKNEHPQVISFVLSYVPADMAGWLLSRFSPSQQAEFTYRIAHMKSPIKFGLRVLDRTLAKRLNAVDSTTSMEVGGVDSVVNIMRGVGRASEKSILAVLDESHPDLSEKIKAKMFVFEDISKLDDRSVQKILKEVNMKTLGLALKKTSDELRELMMNNLSERARMVLEEEIESMGRVPLKDVEEAQQVISEAVRKMEEGGEIVIQKTDEEFV